MNKGCMLILTDVNAYTYQTALYFHNYHFLAGLVIFSLKNNADHHIISGMYYGRNMDLNVSVGQCEEVMSFVIICQVNRIAPLH